MHSIREISPQIFWVGGSDRRLALFENMFPLENGVSYNSYLIRDEKTALLDAVDSSITELHLDNIERALDGRPLDYLVVNHMEPDHCSGIENILRRYPQAKVVGNAKTFQFFSQFYRMDITERTVTVKEGDELALGAHTLRFHMTPMVHWPEVMMACETSKNILFSADAFGTFGALAGNLFADEVTFDSARLSEMRRYYANIVGKYGMQVQAALKKLASTPVSMICPLHGPVWRENFDYLLGKYDLWSRYEPEENSVLLFYASMYGNTARAVSALAGKLAERGVRDMQLYDVSKTHPSYIIADAWKYSHLVAASPTYNLNLYYGMDNLLHEMAALGLKNRKVTLIGNHSWSSAALKKMTELVQSMKDMEIVGEPLDIRSALKPEQESILDALADAICASLARR